MPGRRHPYFAYGSNLCVRQMALRCPRAVDPRPAVLSDHAGGWRVPRAATARIDTTYVIAAAGLLAADYPVAATGLLQSELYSP